MNRRSFLRSSIQAVTAAAVAPLASVLDQVEATQNKITMANGSVIGWDMAKEGSDCFGVSVVSRFDVIEAQKQFNVYFRDVLEIKPGKIWYAKEHIDSEQGEGI